MNNNSTGKSARDRHGLWSRAASALRQLAASRAPGQGCPGMPDESARHTGGIPEEVRNTPTDRFSSQLFASLLLELPQHRRAFTSAWLASDWQTLADCSHRLAGAVAYCDLPELGEALAGLENAIRAGDELLLQQTYNRASREIDDLLAKSGLQGT